MTDLCPSCGGQLAPERRSRWCRDECRTEDCEHARVVRFQEWLRLPLLVLPPDQEAELPSGPERLFFRFQHLIAYQRPAGATGYRIGTMRPSSRVMRFWPPAPSRRFAVYSLEPFELFSVPMVGRYALLYFDGNGEQLGPPRFTILVEHRNRDLRFSDGDRSPRPRRSITR